MQSILCNNNKIIILCITFSVFFDMFKINVQSINQSNIVTPEQNKKAKLSSLFFPSFHLAHTVAHKH